MRVHAPHHAGAEGAAVARTAAKARARTAGRGPVIRKRQRLRRVGRLDRVRFGLGVADVPLAAHGSCVFPQERDFHEPDGIRREPVVQVEVHDERRLHHGKRDVPSLVHGQGFPDRNRAAEKPGRRLIASIEHVHRIDRSVERLQVLLVAAQQLPAVRVTLPYRADHRCARQATHIGPLENEILFEPGDELVAFPCHKVRQRGFPIVVFYREHGYVEAFEVEVFKDRELRAFSIQGAEIDVVEAVLFEEGAQASDRHLDRLRGGRDMVEPLQVPGVEVAAEAAQHFLVNACIAVDELGLAIVVGKRRVFANRFAPRAQLCKGARQGFDAKAGPAHCFLEEQRIGERFAVVSADIEENTVPFAAKETVQQVPVLPHL